MAALLCVGTLAATGCDRSSAPVSSPAPPSPSNFLQRSSAENVHDAPSPSTLAEFAPVRQPDPAGIHNLVRVSPRIFSGSEPHGAEGFASLAKLGIKTVVSVDGARPQIEEAKKHGLQYVHIPIGYDGVDREAALALARAGQQSDGPIYIHCHHGQHRGPAAAAVACVASENRTGRQALQILEVAGTGKQYPGLWRDVEQFTAPAEGETLPELVEVAEVESFAAAMAKIDRNYDNLKLCEKANWSVPADHPDIVALQEAVIMKEGFREATRNLIKDRPAEFKTWMAESAELSERLESALRQSNDAVASKTFKRIDASCKQCHNKYRN